ncbi:uncharacterized protein LOC101706743 isoform X2 [Heterocephalus glaber]|uniref:Uncharacterized protein LOC101706743 isoform X2 n=1 Tax=Heterocephalus glaber TaxID=10181 RepID=A0AAX6S4P0_HETGA|nr:uncharacterized protein LOC101706743 isoform X2 [Heterocephalus glaber]
MGLVSPQSQPKTQQTVKPLTYTNTSHNSPNPGLLGEAEASRIEVRTMPTHQGRGVSSLPLPLFARLVRPPQAPTPSPLKTFHRSAWLKVLSINYGARFKLHTAETAQKTQLSVSSCPHCPARTTDAPHSLPGHGSAGLKCQTSRALGSLSSSFPSTQKLRSNRGSHPIPPTSRPKNYGSGQAEKKPELPRWKGPSWLEVNRKDLMPPLWCLLITSLEKGPGQQLLPASLLFSPDRTSAKSSHCYL